MAPYVTELVDDDVVVLSNPELDGLLVLPRQHIGGIDGLSVLDRAHLLAALRRVARSVQERHPGPPTRIVVFTDPPATEGHVCFHVQPGGLEVR
jgi:diadenosine tetraphosphate (Ap4A) HIT family hydrolase